MKLTYNQPNKKLNVFQWILIVLSLIIVTCFIYGVLLYNNIQKNKTNGFSASEELVMQDTEITQINAVERYHGEKIYHIVFGETADETKQIAFVPIQSDEDEDKQDIIVVNESDIIPKKSILKQWEEQCGQCRSMKITPGIENEDLLWELTYIDDVNRHVLEYLSIYDGSQYEKFRFTQMYQ